MSGRSYGPGVMAVVLLATAGACATPAERRDAVTAQVTRFEQALDAEQPRRLCAALAPTTREELEQSAGHPCDRAIGEQRLPPAGPVRHVDVYGEQARVVLAHDTVFLAHFPTGWKITAAGCRPRPQRPYQCEIKGG
ncbi:MULTISPECIES: hypothetical protein [Streptomyces]|uniref:Lipoprotein n=1 Tax=Streptomyces nigra TaxID=1827580 RepID=A0ABZ1J0H8_9ACTN|nr:hypothetical protein [Streptomyces sp. RK62]MBQ0998701.1 hypothetical protein [Streptomyces sp. RK62]